MNSVKEIRDLLDNIDLGEPNYAITMLDGELRIKLEEWKFKEEVKTADSFWLNKFLIGSLSREFCKDKNKLILNGKAQAIAGCKYTICNKALDIMGSTSPSKEYKRTKVYRQLSNAIINHKSDDYFIDDLLPVVNYYYKSLTDSIDDKTKRIHANNTFALLSILGKKYGGKSV